MALRFSRRITLIPGVRLNIGKKGVSLSAGPRGSSISTGRRGTHVNIGLPGTGISIRNRLDTIGSINEEKQSENNDLNEFSVHLKVDDHGVLSFETENGSPLSPKFIKRIKKEQPDKISQVLQTAANTINKDLDELMAIHHLTPSKNKLSYPEFTIPYPQKPEYKSVNFFHRLLGLATSIENENDKKKSLHNQAVTHWDIIKKENDEEEEHFNLSLQKANSGDLPAMEQVLSYVLSNLKWAKDTQVSFEFKNQVTLALDVDLPNLDDMPKKAAELPSRGYKLLIKDRTETQLRKDFSRLIHAILFRITGEIFSALSALKKIVLSGYVQRKNPATGIPEDVYIISVEIDKEKWMDIDFQQLDTVSPVSALERFNLKKSIDRTSHFGPIDPI